ncbi:hypothetical protein LEMLEM_LOCUS12403, partial [Lemmus lemmus]
KGDHKQTSCKQRRQGCQRSQSVQGGAWGWVQLRSRAGQVSAIWARSEQHPALESPEDSSGVQLRRAKVTHGRGAKVLLQPPPGRRCKQCQPPWPSQKLVAINGRPREPLAASRGVVGRARGRGRLGDAAGNWWADSESPCKRACSVPGGRSGCTAAKVLCCSSVPGTTGASRRSPAPCLRLPAARPTVPYGIAPFGGGDILGCSFRNCNLSDCWDDHASAVLLVRVPAIIPLPITKRTVQTETNLYQEKRDFGGCCLHSICCCSHGRRTGNGTNIIGVRHRG